MNPDWVINEIKYQRALANAQNREDEAEVKELYISYGGKILAGLDVPEVEETPEEETVSIAEEVITPEVEEPEEVIADEPIEEAPIEEEIKEETDAE